MSQTAQSRLELKKVNDRHNFDKMTKLPIEEVFILVKMISSPETNDFRIGGSSKELLLLSLGKLVISHETYHMTHMI